jgi:dihydropyrimidinase
MHDRTGFTPFTGRTVHGWPEIVLRRGAAIVRDGTLKGQPGSGQFLPRSGGASAHPAGRITAEMDPQRNFGASLL